MVTAAMYATAVMMAVDAGRCSISMIQRLCHASAYEAMEIIEAMQADGIITLYDSSEHCYHTVADS